MHCVLLGTVDDRQHSKVPLHMLCERKSVSMDMVRVYGEQCPDALVATDGVSEHMLLFGGG